MSVAQQKLIFVLGGPGSGKGTQCERLVSDYKYCHISIGDLMRSEIQKQTEIGQKIQQLVAKGDIVSPEITVQVLIAGIKEKGAEKYLIDGFPRDLQQAQLFEKEYGEINFILNFQADKETFIQRLLERGKHSGRADDNEETIKHRIEVFNESTMPVINYYSQLNKIFNVDASKSVQEIYQQVIPLINPSIIFLYGPPVIGKNNIAKAIAKSLNYKFIHLEQFYKDNSCHNDTEKVNKLIHYLSNCTEKNFIINSFFDSIEYCKIFFECFVQPKRVYYLNEQKDTIDENILKYIQCQSTQIKKQQQMNKYLDQKNQIINFIQNQSYFRQLDINNQTLQQIEEQIVMDLKPKLYLAMPCSNSQLYSDYIQELQQQPNNYIKLHLPTVIQHEKDAKTEIGLQIERQGLKKHLLQDCLKKIIFNQNTDKKFILTDYSQKPDDIFSLQFLVDFLLIFMGDEKEQQNRSIIYNQYYQKGKLVKIKTKDVKYLDLYTTKQANYLMIYDNPDQSQKSEIAKNLSETFNLKLIDYEKITQMLKEKLGGEEGALESLTFDQILNHLQQEIQNSNGQMILFDGFPYELKSLQKLVNICGQPKYFIQIEMNEEQATKLFKKNNQTEEGTELSQEDQAKIKKQVQTCSEFKQYFQNSEQNSYYTKYHLIQNQQESKQLQQISQLFQQKIFCCSVLDFDHNQGSKVFLEKCQELDILYIDAKTAIIEAYKNDKSLCQKLQTEYEMRWTDQSKNIPSNYSPKLVIQCIKNQIALYKNPSRNIFIYGYPQAENGDNQIYPRVTDEIQCIQENLGPIHTLFSIQNDFTNKNDREYQDPIEFREVQEVQVEEEKKENEEGGDQGNNDEQKIVQFNPKQFNWTESNGKSKNILKVFQKMNQETNEVNQYFKVKCLKKSNELNLIIITKYYLRQQ